MNNASFHEQNDSANPTHTNKGRLNWTTYLIELKNILFLSLSPPEKLPFGRRVATTEIHRIPKKNALLMSDVMRACLCSWDSSDWLINITTEV